jgi:hypothetical protein
MVIIHHISCTKISGPDDTMDFQTVKELALRIERYAKRLGFDVMYENVDEET